MADERGGRRVLDENGRLFGLINIIDLFVVILVLAVLAAGIAFVLTSSDSGGPEPESDTENTTQETRFATIDLGTQPEYVAAAIRTERNTSAGEAADSLAITDTYVYGSDDEANVIIRTRLNGTEVTESGMSRFQFRGNPLYLGDELQFQTDLLNLTGTISTLDSDGETLPKRESELLVQTTVPADTAGDVTAGDEHRFGGSSNLQIKSVTEYATGESDMRRLVLGVAAETIERSGTAYLGDKRIRKGVSIPFETDEYALETHILHRDGLELPGETRTRTITLELENRNPSEVERIDIGDTEQIRGHTTATILSKSVEPAEVIVTNADGDMFVQDHPRNADVRLEVELTVREQSDRPLTFRNKPLRSGTALTLEFGDYRLTGEVGSINR